MILNHSQHWNVSSNLSSMAYCSLALACPLTFVQHDTHSGQVVVVEELSNQHAGYRSRPTSTNDLRFLDFIGIKKLKLKNWIISCVGVTSTRHTLVFSHVTHRRPYNRPCTHVSFFPLYEMWRRRGREERWHQLRTASVTLSRVSMIATWHVSSICAEQSWVAYIARLSTDMLYKSVVSRTLSGGGVGFDPCTKWPIRRPLIKFKTLTWKAESYTTDSVSLCRNAGLFLKFAKINRQWKHRKLVLSTTQYSRLTPTLEGTLANIHINFILLETRLTCPTFSPLIAWFYIHSVFVVWASKTHAFWNRVRDGRSGSSKIVDFGTNRKRVRNFLLIINSNFWSYLTPFQRYCRFCAENSDPHLFHPNFGVFSLN